MCRRSPELAELRRQAREAARTSRTNWYADWCERSRDVADLAVRIADANRVGTRETICDIRGGLIDTYHDERHRQRRKKLERRTA